MKRPLRLAAVLAGTTLLTVAAPALASAATGGDVAYGVTSSGNRLVTFDPQNPGVAGQGTPITGLGSGELVVGIEYSVVNGLTYVLTDDTNGVGRLYTVDPATAVATPVSATTYALNSTADQDKFDIDINPCDGALRIVGSNETNLRVNPLTGALLGTDTALTYAAGDTNASSVPTVGGALYTAPTASSCSTTLYDADFITNSLARQGSIGGAPESPNAGVLHTVGSFGIDPTSLLGFDQSSTTGNAYLAAQTANKKGVVSPATQIYTVNLSTGAASPVATVFTVGSDLLGTFTVAPNTTPPAALPDFGMPAVAIGLTLAAGGAVAVRRRRSA